MHADYVPNPLYDNNPFIEALPPIGTALFTTPSLTVHCVPAAGVH